MKYECRRESPGGIFICMKMPNFSVSFRFIVERGLAPTAENGIFSDFPKGNDDLLPTAMAFCKTKCPAGASPRPTV
jgi:hypothetical protein